jgi:hypothetical protein
MSYPLPVFVSSTCHELRDLRAAIKKWLRELGMTPMMSDDRGFPHVDGMPPYATCLRVVEQCPLVIGVIDRRYGQPFDDWGPYKQYAGCAPTHAELRHALELGKRVLIYVHDDTWNFYEVWRKNPDAFNTSAPAGLDEATLRMFKEWKIRNPAPWIEHFTDAAMLIQSLQSEFVNQLYSHLQEREKQSADLAAYLLEKIIEAAPEVRTKIEASLSPSLVADRERLRRQLSAIETKLETTQGASQEMLQSLKSEKAAVEGRLAVVAGRVVQMKLLLARAALKDASWLNWVRSTMMPRQPTRVPFHHSDEVALRGYHAAAGGQRRKPTLLEVTWSKVHYKEGGLHRGYHAALIFRGSEFVPGVTYTQRRCGEKGPPAGQKDYRWRLPNIYFGDYLEVSTSEREPESPLSSRDYEFQVRNPEGDVSAWVTFTYPFDDEALERLQSEHLQRGEEFLAAGKPAEAVESLRKAYHLANRLFGAGHEKTRNAERVWHHARERAALARLRFRTGDVLVVHSGQHAGKSGIVEKLLLNQVHAYLIKPKDGDTFQASDEQVERSSMSEIGG